MVATAGGFFLARHIHQEKAKGQPLVCPLNSNCHAVVHSKFSTFLNVPMEMWGMWYYGLLFIGYSLMVIYPPMQTPLVVLALVTISSIAFLFSLYLTFIQMFALKEWCTWCLTSAGLCLIIFSFAWASAPFAPF
jgi:uncharacterized membrane protein